MAIIAKGNTSTFEPAPEGVSQAVCCDVIDLGVLETAFGDKHKIDIRWQTAELMGNGKPYLVTKRYTLSLHEKANLTHDLEAWRGKPFSDTEREGFDVEKLIGANCQLNIVHKPGRKGGTFANVVSIMPLGRGMKRIDVTEYERVKDRNDTPEPGETRDGDDDIPF